jgi:hypothetical protein
MLEKAQKKVSETKSFFAAAEIFPFFFAKSNQWSEKSFLGFKISFLFAVLFSTPEKKLYKKKSLNENSI